MSAQWPPTLPPDADWQAVVDLQLRPWLARGSLDVHKLLLDTSNLRRPPAAGPVSNPVAALVDTKTWHVRPMGAKWVGHHPVRMRAVLNIFRMTQRTLKAAGSPLPDIQFVLVLSDGHGLHPRDFDNACTCKTTATCCEPKVLARAREAPAAPVFATMHCRHTWDVSVPTIIDDLLDTRSAASINASLHKWLAMGDAHPWAARRRRAFFVGDAKAYRPNAIRLGRGAPDLFDARYAVSSNRTARVPFAEHAKYIASVYAHGFHFNSVRWRRLALLRSAVIAEEAPCKEWWSLRARPWVHYAPTHENFDDLVGVARRLLDPARDAEARAMAARLRRLAVDSFAPEGLVGYIAALWRTYARLQHARTGGGG